MVENVKQFSLFNVVEYGGKLPRGKYKEKEKKVEPLNPYVELSQILSQLANYFPIPIMSNATQEDLTIAYNLFNFHYNHHSCQEYEYYGDKFIGDDFNIIEAELIGTEDLFIQERLFIHKKLLELIHKGVNIHEAANRLQPFIQAFNDGSLILE